MCCIFNRIAILIIIFAFFSQLIGCFSSISDSRLPRNSPTCLQRAGLAVEVVAMTNLEADEAASVVAAPLVEKVLLLVVEAGGDAVVGVVDSEGADLFFGLTEL
jgi:hypothetical protein